MNRLALFFVLLLCGVADAHPMGNYSINHYSRLQAVVGKLKLLYILDFAEIPTIAEQSSMDANSDRKVSRAEKVAYQQRRALSLQGNLTLQANGSPLRFALRPAGISFIPGAANLQTLREVYEMQCDLPAAPVHINYRDSNYADRVAGWKEIIVTAAGGAHLTKSTASTRDRSRQLTSFTSTGATAPPQDLEADFTIDTGANANAQGVLPQEPTAASISDSHTPQNRFTQVLAVKQLTPGLMLAGLLIAFMFGGAHALAPGHGKTMVAAYLVGSRGTARQAALLGVVVTITHTFGVFALGLITLFASNYIVPESLERVLGVASGFCIFSVGIWMLFSRLRALGVFAGWSRDHHNHPHAHSHDHNHEHDHHHHDDHHHHHDDHHHHHDHHEHKHVQHSASHGPEPAGHSHAPLTAGHSHGPGGYHTHEVPEGPVDLRTLVALGISGGIVPCPEALVVLLAAIQLHRIAYGMLLIAFFSLGLAAVLILIGLVVVSAGRRLGQATEGRPGVALLTRYLPIGSAAAITVIGLVLMYRTLATGTL